MVAVKVLVAGASGFAGRRLCPALAEAGHDVAAMTRNPDRYTGAGTPVYGDARNPGTLSTAIFPAATWPATSCTHSAMRTSNARMPKLPRPSARRPGSPQFYVLTMGVAGTWAAGALGSGPPSSG